MSRLEELKKQRQAPSKLDKLRQHVVDAMRSGRLDASVRIHGQNFDTARMLQEARRETVLDDGSAEEMRTVVITDKHGKFAVDPRTGEVLLADRLTPEPASVGFHTVDGYVGIDTVWPAEATTAHALLKATAPHDRWQDNLHLAEWRLLGLLETGVSGDAVRILKFICERLVARNIWFGHLAEIDGGLRLAERSRKRAVAELVAARLLSVGSSSRSRQTKVQVHPWYAFRGDRSAQDNSLRAWLVGHPHFTGAKSGTPSGPQLA